MTDLGYYSLSDLIHYNDISNGHDVMAPAAFKRTFKGITLFQIIGPSLCLNHSAGKTGQSL